MAIIMDPSELDSVVNNLNECCSEIESIWSNVKNNDLASIEKSWAGAAAKTYTEKARAIDSDVQSALEAMRLIAGAFNDAKQQLVTADENAASRAANL